MRKYEKLLRIVHVHMSSSVICAHTHTTHTAHTKLSFFKENRSFNIHLHCSYMRYYYYYYYYILDSVPALASLRYVRAYNMYTYSILTHRHHFIWFVIFSLVHFYIISFFGDCLCINSAHISEFKDAVWCQWKKCTRGAWQMNEMRSVIFSHVVHCIQMIK